MQPASQWGWNEVLLNKTNYLLDMLVWMKTKDAQKKQPQHKPKPFIPDFMPGGQVAKESQAMDIDELKAILSAARVEQKD